jgi:hypothetical protein
MLKDVITARKANVHGEGGRMMAGVSVEGRV